MKNKYNWKLTLSATDYSTDISIYPFQVNSPK